LRISDLIAQYILDTLETKGTMELQRCDLADRFNCAPSQINYVISTRFMPEQGYLVESRRGGGGYIRIVRVNDQRPAVVMHTVNSIGDSLSMQSAVAIIRNLMEMKAVSEEAAGLMVSAVTETALSPAPSELRPLLRAKIIKQCLVAHISS